jgi:uncharacterized small protein (DUF1192 family)
MPKALIGHFAQPDPRAVAEIAALRRRVAELTDEVDRLRAELGAVADLDAELATLDAATPSAV